MINYQLLPELLAGGSLLPLVDATFLVSPFSSTPAAAAEEPGAEVLDAVDADDGGREGGLGDGDVMTPLVIAVGEAAIGRDEAGGGGGGWDCLSSSWLVWRGSTGPSLRLLAAVIDRLTGRDMTGGGGGGGDCSISTESSGLRRRDFFSGFMITSDFSGKLFRRSIFSTVIWLLLLLEASERGEGGVEDEAEAAAATAAARSCWCCCCICKALASEVAILISDRFNCCCSWCTCCS